MLGEELFCKEGLWLNFDKNKHETKALSLSTMTYNVISSSKFQFHELATSTFTQSENIKAKVMFLIHICVYSTNVKKVMLAYLCFFTILSPQQIIPSIKLEQVRRSN